MSVLRSYQRFQVCSIQWNTVTRLNSTRTAVYPNDYDPSFKNTYWYKRAGGKIKEFNEVPGPRFLPFIGHDWRYHRVYGMYDREKIHRTFAKLHRQYGYVVKEHIGKDRVIVHLFHPEDIRLVYMNDGKYPTRMSHRIVAKYRKERPHLYDSPGLGPSNGEEWYNFRMQFVGRGVNFVRDDNFSELEQAADDFMLRMQSRFDKDGEVDVMPLLYRWTLEGVGIGALRCRLGCLDEIPNPDADKLIDAAHTFNDVVYRTETMSTGHEEQYARLVPAEDYFASVVRKHVDQAIEDLPKRENILLRGILESNPKRNDLHTFFLDLFHAGIHTAAATTAFALYHLARNKDVQDRLRTQLLDVLPLKDSRYVGSKANATRYLGWVIRETLRLNPPTIGNGRVIKVPIVLGGYRIPEGTMVLLHHQVASLQEENFDDSLSFRPERFDKHSNFRSKAHASRPFGFSARICVGMTLAKGGMELALAKLVRNFEISYHHGELDTVNRLHNEPDKPVKLRFKHLSY